MRSQTFLFCLASISALAQAKEENKNKNENDNPSLFVGTCSKIDLLKGKPTVTAQCCTGISICPDPLYYGENTLDLNDCVGVDDKGSLVFKAKCVYLPCH